MFIDKIMQHVYIYNIAWEDPRVDRKLLKLSSSDRVFMLASAGCNVLDYLLESPAQIVACDKNPFQLHLLHLKLAMLRDPALTYDEWWAVWGLSDAHVAAKSWKRARHNAPPDSVKFWDARVADVFAAPFSASGSCGSLFHYGLPAFMRMLGLSIDELRSKLDAPHDELVHWLERHRVIDRFAACIANAVKTPFFCSMLGVPSSQTAECPFVATQEFWRDLGEAIFVNDETFAIDNYFYYFYIMGRFSNKCAPRILKRDHFDALRRNVDRVVVHEGLTWDVMNRFEDGHFTRFVLLDHMDWMTNEQIQDEWHVLAKKAAPDARVLWRSLHRNIESRYPFFAALGPLVDNVSASVYAEDRVKMYLGTYLARLPETLHIPRITQALANGVSTYDRLACVANMLAHPLVTAVSRDCGTDHRSRMDAFYAAQARAYDDVRERMLSARTALISLMGPFEGAAPRTWLDIGGGTGRNVRYLSEHFDLFDQIVVVDICTPLLEEGERVARQTLREEEVAKMRWVRADCTADDFLETVRTATGRTTFDRVTFSYSLSMMPDWRSAVRQASRLCAGGKLIVADFDTFSEEGAGWKDLVLAKWFAQDGVEISAERRDFLRAELGDGYVKRWTEDGLVPGLGLPHYVYSVQVRDGSGL